MSSNVEVIQTDFVVVGGAGTGLTAAVAAAEQGVKVTIVEKRDSLGGNSTVSGAFFACDSPALARAEIDAPADHFFKALMDWSHWKVNPRLVRAYINKSGKTIAWLEDKGLKFNASVGQSIVREHTPRITHRPANGGSPGGEICKLLIQQCEDLGVKVLLNTTAKKILRGDDGIVTGVLASSADKDYRINARATLICTGGYPNNKEMIKKYNPAFKDGSIYVGIPEVVGEGVEMTMEIGCATESLGAVHYMGLHFPGNSAVISRINWFPQPVWVNKKGERFCDETVVFDMGTRGNVLERQPDQMAYVIFDDKLKEKFINDRIDKTATTETAAAARWVDLPKDLEAEQAKGNVKISGSWSEIAQWMGIAPEVLQATIDEYNKACECGYDEVFLKERAYLYALVNPPYYAVKNGSDYPCTMGGIKINHVMQVLDKENEDPIPGLYCAGTDAGGWESETYCFYLNGSILAWRVISGQMAGESAAKYVLGD
jgi:fumarate reductase flavoprotein subunit